MCVWQELPGDDDDNGDDFIYFSFYFPNDIDVGTS